MELLHICFRYELLLQWMIDTKFFFWGAWLLTGIWPIKSLLLNQCLDFVLEVNKYLEVSIFCTSIFFTKTYLAILILLSIRCTCICILTVHLELFFSCYWSVDSIVFIFTLMVICYIWPFHNLSHHSYMQSLNLSWSLNLACNKTAKAHLAL